METDPVFRQYREKRTRLYERLDVIREQVSQWLERHAETSPELTDIARLEALHRERGTLLSEFYEIENAFIEHLLARRRE